MDVHHHCRDHHHSNMNDVVKFKPKKKNVCGHFQKKSIIDLCNQMTKLQRIKIDHLARFNHNDAVYHYGGYLRIYHFRIQKKNAFVNSLHIHTHQ